MRALEDPGGRVYLLRGNWAMTTCQAVRPDTKETCEAPATYVVTFTDGAKARACEECALRLQAVAGDVHARIRMERAKP